MEPLDEGKWARLRRRLLCREHRVALGVLLDVRMCLYQLAVEDFTLGQKVWHERHPDSRTNRFQHRREQIEAMPGQRIWRNAREPGIRKPVLPSLRSIGQMNEWHAAEVADGMRFLIENEQPLKASIARRQHDNSFRALRRDGIASRYIALLSRLTGEAGARTLSFQPRHMPRV